MIEAAPVVERPQLPDPPPRPVPEPDPADDLGLLAQYEPIVRYTKGEPFFPSDVERYLARCTLWAHLPDGHELELVPSGQMNLDTLTQPRSTPFGSVLYLKLVGALNLAESAAALRQRALRPPEQRFRSGTGRLARVGYLSRMVDALFSVSLLLRGRVPGATAAAAELLYQEAQAADDRYVYYGRVVRDSGWVVLQYWFFYWYNSWRSGFHGVNDHESDWEQILVYLYEDPGGDLVPEWVAYASHDFHGADMRRRWDDPSGWVREGSHPVVFAGAGSHASYFLPGEYQTDVSLPLPERIQRLAAALNRLWTNALGQARRAPEVSSPLRIPFVDFARGDGLAVGPGQAKTWTRVNLGPPPGWAASYRGLWGLFARDPISGENAPAGPAYNRDGSPRGAWFDPLGFAGLDRVPPPPEARRLLAERQAGLAARQAAIRGEIATHSAALQAEGAQLEALNRHAHLARPHRGQLAAVDAAGAQLRELRREYAENEILAEALAERAERLAQGRAEGPQAHLKHLAMPATAAELRFARLAELWAAVSVGLLVIVAITVLFFLPETSLGVSLMILGALAVTFLLVDSVLRGTFVRTMGAISVALAVISLVIIFINTWWQALILAIIAAGVFLLLENLRELRA